MFTYLQNCCPRNVLRKTSRQKYYRDGFAEDGKRVGRLFDLLHEIGVPVENRYAVELAQSLLIRLRLT